MSRRVPFIVASMGDVDPFMLHILCRAGRERASHDPSHQTTAALAEARRRGVRLGNPE